MKKKVEIALFLLFILLINPVQAYHAVITGTAKGLNIRDIHLSCSAWLEDQVSLLDPSGKFTFVLDNPNPAMYTLRYGSGRAMLKTELFIFSDLNVEADLISEPSGEKIWLRVADRRCNAFKAAKNYMDDQWINKRTDIIEQIVPKITAIPFIENDMITEVFAKSEMLNYMYLMGKNYGKAFDKKPFERAEFASLPMNESFYMGFPAYRELMAAYNMEKFMAKIFDEGKNTHDFEVVMKNIEELSQNLPEQTRFDLMVQILHKFPHKDLPTGQEQYYVSKLRQITSNYPNNDETIMLELQIVDILNSIVNRPAPDFKLKDETGTEVSLADFSRSFVLIDVWGSWCRPCRVKNQALLELYKTIKDYSMEVVLVSISNDTDEELWKEAISQDGMIWTQLLADKDFLGNYNIKEYPTMILIDKDGKIRKVGSDISLNDLIDIMY